MTLSGLLKLDSDNNLKVIIDTELHHYLYSLIPKSWGATKYGHTPHITIIRNFEINKIINIKETIIQYDYLFPIYKNDRHVMINVTSNDGCNIRESLGLSQFRESYQYFHITLGNL